MSYLSLVLTGLLILGTISGMMEVSEMFLEKVRRRSRVRRERKRRAGLKAQEMEQHLKDEALLERLDSMILFYQQCMGAKPPSVIHMGRYEMEHLTDLVRRRSGVKYCKVTSYKGVSLKLDPELLGLKVEG